MYGRRMIEVEHLSKVYGSTPAIRDVTFRVETGEIVGFLGPNGAGKTTTMRILTGYLPATTGRAQVAGFEVHDQPMAVRRVMGYLPELPPLYPHMRVEEFLWFVSRLKGVPAGDRGARVQAALLRCQLGDCRRQWIGRLSKGYRQRVGLAQAIVHDPPVLILDEPTVGLDPKQIREVRDLIRSFGGEKTVILSSHILPEVSMTCDRVVIIDQGEVIATNTPEELQSQSVGQQVYEVEWQGGEGAAMPDLTAIPGVLHLEWLGGGNGEGDRRRCRLICTPEGDPGPQIAAALVHGGMALCELRRSRPSLEDVFLGLITQESPEAEATDDVVV